MGKDYYAVLGCAKDAGEKEIKKAYKKQAMRWHPDKNPEKQEEAEVKFKEIAEAYDVLSDEKKRKIFDQFGEEGLKQGPGGGGGFPGGGGMPGGGFSYEFRGDPHDIFKTFFNSAGGGFGGFGEDFGGGRNGGGMGGMPGMGGGMGGMPFFMGGMPGMGGMGGGMPGMPGMGAMGGQQPFVTDLKLTLEELYTGVTKKLKITRKSVTPGRSTEHTFEIKVQPGWKADTKLTFAGEGDERSAGHAQDVIFVVKEKPHKHFKRSGSDLIYNVNIGLRDALCGFKVTVPTLEGKTLEVKVRDVISPNATKVVPGEGMPKRKEAGARGDLILSFQVAFPKTLPDDVKVKIREILPAQRA